MGSVLLAVYFLGVVVSFIWLLRGLYDDCRTILPDCNWRSVALWSCLVILALGWPILAVFILSLQFHTRV